MDATRATLTALGIGREEAAGRRLANLLQDLLPATSDARSANPLPELHAALGRAAAGESARCERTLRSTKGGGELLAVELAVRPIVDDYGKVAFLLVEVLEGHAQSTGKHQTERRLEAAERERRRLQNLVDQAPAGIAWVAGPRSSLDLCQRCVRAFERSKLCSRFSG